MLAIQLNIFMTILLAGITVHAYFKLDRKEQVHRLFFELMLLTIVILILEILSVVLNSGVETYFMIAHKLVNILGFTLTPLVPIIVVLYVYKRTNRYKKITMYKFFWLSIPFVIASILSIGSYHFNWIFSITDQNMYLRGSLWLVSPMTSYFYYILNILILYDCRKKLNKEELLMLSLLTIIPAVLSSFQLYYFVYLTIWNSVAIAVILNYIFIIHSHIKIDPLTGLGNRLAYNEYLASLRRKSNIVLSVISIDLDNFKRVNDLWGHHEGDKALRIFARQLEDVFERNGVSIRWGGDEFIVLLNENRKEVLEKYLKTLIDKINEYDERNDLPYQINFSYGMTIFNNAYHSIDDLIQDSDKLMYQEKQRK